MTAPNAGPRCPRCHRPLAAWRLEHCVYCGEPFPPGLKQGFTEPEALKWIERPPLPADLARKVEMLRIPTGAPKKARSFMAIGAGVAVPIAGVLFYMLYSMIRQLSPAASILILIAGIGVVGYLGWLFIQTTRD